ncbi:small subunit processome component 20 homolog [Topomyia yanbarensis]|uniref:small subunit processome component 20 homolog n=1 Tax=Topomyia yanbarensis TaxID=2498891 RepID=UPI00273BB752|nr:small subunit processome component 20 homolog [Topomyia yanbarensis]
MKNRQVKHKSKNVFQFKSFNERIAEVDIRRSALYYVEHENEQFEDDRSYFHQSIQKWSALNLTEEFQRFHDPLRGIVTLPQLLHRKDFVLQHLIKCIENASSLSLQVLLEIVIALAKDLRDDFCPFFFIIFDKLVPLLDTRDADQLEWTLLCLAFLFKILRGFLRKSLYMIFERVVLLLDDSKPLHLTNFAAECFSFIARDTKNKRELIYMITMAASRNPSASTGCGRLLFEIMRGVNQQFHSCAEHFWKLVLLEMIYEKPNTENGYDPKFLFDILIQTVTDMLQCIKPDSIKQFWAVTYEALEKYLTKNQFANETGFHYVLQLTGIVLEYQHGKFLDNNSTMIGKLVKTIGVTESEEILMSVSKIATIMLLSKNLNITQLEASRLTKNIMSLGSRSEKVFDEFVLSVVDCSIFEILVLPDYLKYIEKNFSAKNLQSLTKIVIKKSPLCRYGVNLKDWKQFPIILKCDKGMERISQLLKGGQQKDDRTEFYMCLILLPHLKNFAIDKSILKALEMAVQCVLSDLEKNFDNLQLTLNLLIETLVHLNISEEGIFLETVNRLLPIIASSNREQFIGIVNMCLVHISREYSQSLDESLFDTVHSHLCVFLASVHHQTRLLVAHTFTLFGHLERLKIKNETQTMFDILYAIEAIDPNIHTYREQVVLLKRLEFDANFFQGIRENELRLDIMRFVLSMLSCNFKLLWEPAGEVLQSYAESFPVSDFWNVYKHQLDAIFNALRLNSTVEQFKHVEGDILNDIVKQLWIEQDKIDFVNYRVQLLVLLSKLSRIFEAKNRDIVESFFCFIESEYRIKQTVESEALEIPKAAQKILIAYLNIFSGVKNPKTIFKTRQLHEFFLELLTHRNYDVQKLALDCIFTYDSASLIPYKDTLYSLSNDKTVKEEMAKFFTETIESENDLRCVVLEEHRREVIPLVMKIVHTKMIKKTTPLEMKNLLLRFVGNFRENEINLFISMSFGYFEKLLRSSPLETYEHINASERNFEEDLPIHRLQVLMKLIHNIREEFAGLKNYKFIQYLLHIKLCMDAIISKIEHSKTKQLKSQATLNMADFFEHFDNYEWSEEEIEAMFRIYVWPQLDKLDSDCIHSPTPLLKLLVVWSRNPRYYLLLSKTNPGETVFASFTPLSKVINLLNNEKASDNVCQEISKMIINMLTLEAVDSGFSSLPIRNTQQIDESEAARLNLNVGSCLVLPFLEEILGHIQKIMRRKRSISTDHLLILSRVTEYVREGELCDTIGVMLFPITIKKIALPNIETESVRDMHVVLLSLLRLGSHPEKHIRLIGLLLERVKDLVTRKIICQMIQLVAEKTSKPDLIQCASIIEDMNAMDKRWLDQPDFQRRLDAFRRVDKLIENQDIISLDFIILFVHQCFYYLKTNQDLAMRDNANHYLRKVVIKAINMRKLENQGDVQYLVERVILMALMKGVKDKNDATRNESIQLLGDLSRECADYHTVFADLHPFTNSDDREVDFFDNMIHLQIHRHRRAMNRFCKISRKLGKMPSSRTLVDFVLPIVTTYICSEKYRKKSKLTEAAGKCVSLVGRMLPWPSYKSLLKQYLNKMKNNIEYQKQLIKIVVSLLDNFHFDLSNADTSSLPNISDIVYLNSSIGATADVRKNAIDVENQAPVESDEENVQSDGRQNVSLTSRMCLTKENAESVMVDISKIIIPDLFSTINYKEAQDTHKLNERKERYAREKKDMLKIPLAIAIVKLLQKLPKQFIELNLPKLFIRVINFLKSNLKQVRSTARDTLKSMILSVGPLFLRNVLENLSAVLTRGFQVHVLIATVHSLLDALKERLSSSIVDDVLQLVITMCINDIFGRISEEKEIGSVVRKTPEAKPSKKSYLTLQILAKNISEKSALDMILPFKDIITKTYSRKTVTKAQEVLNKIADGICSNENISVEAMLILVFGITSEIIPDLICGRKQTILSEKQKNEIKQGKPDVYIIPTEPKRRGAGNPDALVTVSKANSHVLVEMGFEILHNLIKKNQILSVEYEPFLEPLIPVLIDSMNSNHIKITILGIKCIISIWTSRLDISSVVLNIDTIVNNLLNILHKYATAGIGRNDDNYQLVKIGFKAIVTLMKFVKYFTIGSDQLKLLLLYVEQDLFHPDRQNMALILLRSIVGRKLIADEMASIIKKVAELSITSGNDKFRYVYVYSCETILPIVA